MTVKREEANQRAFERLSDADPVLIDVQKAGEAMPGMQPNMVLTAGAPLPWEEYEGPQRMGILYGALYEGLAETVEEAEAKIRSGEIVIGSTHHHGCVGVHLGIHTASMSVFVVEDRKTGARGYCNFFEGDAERRLSMGFYGDEVVEKLGFVEEVVAPTIGEAVRRSGGVPLRPLIRRALRLGDDGHVRCSAGTMLFTRALLPTFLDLARERADEVRQTVVFLEGATYSFLRPWLAAAKAMSQAIAGIEGSSIVTVMAANCREFSIQVSGLGEEWFHGPHPGFEGRLFDGRWVTPDTPLPDNYGLIGTDSPLAECLGFGGLAGAAAFPLQVHLGGSTADIVKRNRAMYDITVGEHPDYKIPFFDHRGVPLGIDIFKVIETGVTPVINGAIVEKDIRQKTGGLNWTNIGCFEAAAAAFQKRYVA